MTKSRLVCLNPFGTGRGLSTTSDFENLPKAESQSLWNRAGSFDTVHYPYPEHGTGVSIPLEQGGVFRLQGWFGALMDKAWEDRFPIFSLMRKVRYEFD